MFQPITAEDLLTKAPDLADELAALKRWMDIKRFARNVYGPAAHHAEVTVSGEYNDEDGYDYSVDDVTVYDQNGDELMPDLSLPFWDEVRQDVDPESGEWETWSYLRDTICDDLPYGEEAEGTYIFDAPPSVKLPDLYVKESD